MTATPCRFFERHPDTPASRVLSLPAERIAGLVSPISTARVQPRPISPRSEPNAPAQLEQDPPPSPWSSHTPHLPSAASGGGRWDGCSRPTRQHDWSASRPRRCAAGSPRDASTRSARQAATTATTATSWCAFSAHTPQPRHHHPTPPATGHAAATLSAVSAFLGALPCATRSDALRGSHALSRGVGRTLKRLRVVVGPCREVVAAHRLELAPEPIHTTTDHPDTRSTDAY